MHVINGAQSIVHNGHNMVLGNLGAVCDTGYNFLEVGLKVLKNQEEMSEVWNATSILSWTKNFV